MNHFDPNALGLAVSTDHEKREIVVRDTRNNDVFQFAPLDAIEFGGLLIDKAKRLLEGDISSA